MEDDRLLLIGCGILKSEIQLLVEKNHWPLDTKFLDSALHVDFNRLAHGLTVALDESAGRSVLVVYGACHPQMDILLRERKLSRMPGQNCIEMLLGHVRFTDELANGAFFLMEDWARRWDFVMREALGSNRQIVRNVFQGDRRYILGLRTPCSGDFSAEAQQIASQVGLPLQWMDVSLDHLESLIQEAIDQETRGHHG